MFVHVLHPDSYRDLHFKKCKNCQKTR